MFNIEYIIAINVTGNIQCLGKQETASAPQWLPS